MTLSARCNDHRDGFEQTCLGFTPRRCEAPGGCAAMATVIVKLPAPLPTRVLSFDQVIADADRIAGDASKPDDVRARARSAAEHFRKLQGLKSKELWPMPEKATPSREERRRMRNMQRAKAWREKKENADKA